MMKQTYKYLYSFLILQFTIFIFIIIGYKNQLCYLFIFGLCIAACILTFLISKQLHNYNEMKAINSLHRYNQKMQEKYYIDLKNSEQIVNTIKKDINLKIQTFEKQNQVNESSLLKEYQYLCSIDYCDNTFIDAILYNKLILAKNSHIKTSIKVHIPHQINLNPVDMISLYTNLLDNAIEACILCLQEERFITLHCYVYQQNLMIDMKNSKHPDSIVKNKRKKSIKEGDHGLGLHIIQQICDKYQGTFDIKDSISSVETTITLAIPDK